MADAEKTREANSNSGINSNSGQSKRPSRDGWRLVIIAVDDEIVGRNALEWYHDNIHRPDNLVHVCHVPNFRDKVEPNMDPVAILRLMKNVNNFAEGLKYIYEGLLCELQINGKFIRIGGNTPWSALIEYCKRQKGSLMVVASRTRCPNTSATDLTTADLIMGSMTRDLLVHCPVPVLVARPPEQPKPRATGPM
ncbi:uncharacterized protein LOC101859232 [Aplysia californica]|uniref:Uncharacterized protein LOC101859232 n=1 Tax=Aplysia californica TaxID=6500 RepID=A0ABM1VQT2_APLCA|nr:uncharacterized protein LOC101859232 [Aplysia californica]